MVDVTHPKRSFDGEPAVSREYKKPKLSELPIDQAKKSAIDGLVHNFRKKGEFDNVRTTLRAQFEASPAKAKLLAALEELVERETEKTPSFYLSKDPNIAASLLEGVVERSGLYKDAADTIAKMLDDIMEDTGRAKMREYRINEVGAEAAAEEEKRGSKSEEEWAREAEERQREREAAREREALEREKEEKAKREERRRREREDEERRAKERQAREEREEKRRREEEERRREDRERIEREKEEDKKKRREREEKEEAERAARLKRIREEDRERERKFEEERERNRDRDRDRRRDHRRDNRRDSRARSRTPDRRRERLRDRDDDRERTRRRSRTRSPVPTESTKLEDAKVEVDDDLALRALLQETEEMKKSKSRQGPFLSRRSLSLEPPLPKVRPPKSLVPQDPATARLGAIEGKSHSPAIKSPSKVDAKFAASPATPSLSKDDDAHMEEGLVVKSTESESKSRWDRPPTDGKHDKTRGRSRSGSAARSVSIRKHSRSRSRGSRVDRRASFVERDRRTRRDDDRRASRPVDDDQRKEKDDRDDKHSRRGDNDSRRARSPSRETYSSRRKSRYHSRSPSPDDRRRDRPKSRSRSRGGHRTRDRSPAARRRNRSRSRSLERIDRYLPGGGQKRDYSRDRNDRRDQKRPRKEDSRYRRDYDRYDGNREGRTRLQESDRYLPGRESTQDDRGKERDRSRDQNRKRRDASRSRSRSRNRSRNRRR